MCYCDMFNVVNVYLYHLKFCVVCINGQRYAFEVNVVVSDECDEPTSCRVQPIVAHCSEVMYVGCFDFWGDLGFLNCDDIGMCVVNKQFELLEFVLSPSPEMEARLPFVSYVASQFHRLKICHGTN